MKTIRIIPRLDVKGPNIVKGIQLEGLRIVGKPDLLAKKYYDQGADEILYIDTVASLYNRNNLIPIVEQTANSGLCIPMTVGGGVRSIDDVRGLLRSGADKVAINTQAIKTPGLITEAAQIFGSQCIVGHVEAKKNGEKWEAYYDNGREITGLDAIDWAKKLEELGAGELLVTSVDRDGTRVGYDIDLMKKIIDSVSIPVIVSGGAGKVDDVIECLDKTRCEGIAIGTIFHYNDVKLDDLKETLKSRFKIRQSASLKKETRKSKKTVSIVDYDAGNLRSVTTTFKLLGCETKIITKPEEIRDSELLVLPGDGAFPYAMRQLEEKRLIKPIKEYVASGKPFLGICLGMQLLMTESDEFGNTPGLGLIKGKVKKFEMVKDITVPHIGWNALQMKNPWKGTILENIPDGSLSYFVHSFKVLPDEDVALANTRYGGQDFCSVLKKDNIYATQFHPEKSGGCGIEMLRFFSEL